MNKYIILALALSLVGCGGTDAEENSPGFTSISGKSVIETTEDNDTISTAQVVSIGSAITGSVSTSDVIDVYQFDTKKGQRVEVNFDGGTGSDGDIYLYNSDYNVLRISHEDGSEESMVYDASYTGTLYLVVKHYEGDDSTYQMSIASSN